MKKLPQRLSLVSQAADILREQLAAGLCGDILPGERALCARLQVSRPTLRAALETRRREGWLEVSQGRRRRIHPPDRKHRVAAHPARVGLLTPVPLHRMPPFTMFWVDELRERLADEGFELTLHVNHASGLSQPEHWLQRVTAETPSAAWVVFRSSKPMQAWFDAHGLPAVIIGSRFPDIGLPSVDLDYRAACRHAAGIFLARGRRRLALLLPEGGGAGDQASEAGFLEGCRAAGRDAVATVVRHDESVAGIARRLDSLRAAAEPVTALLVARSAHALTVLTHLQRRGVRLPQDVSLISRDDDAFLDAVVPSVARYACDPAAFARRVSRIVLQLARTGAAPARQTLMMPAYVKGETAG